MEMGPLQLVVVGFDHPTLDGSILTELMKLSDQGLVRLVDLLGVYKSDSGELAAVELSDLGLDEAITYGAWVGALLGLGAAGEEGLEVWAFAGALLAENEFEYGLDEEAIRTIGNDIPNGGRLLTAPTPALAENFANRIASEVRCAPTCATTNLPAGEFFTAASITTSRSPTGCAMPSPVFPLT